MTTVSSDKDLSQKVVILADFYLKKGQPAVAKEFLLRISNPPDFFQYYYLLGKVEYRLKNHVLAFAHLDKARQLNPLHKPTLLLLYVIHQKREDWNQALECVVDLFLLSKEVQDKYVPRYKRKIRELVGKITPPLEPKQKNRLIKDRNQHLNKLLTVFENHILKASNPAVAKSDEAVHEIQLELTPVVSSAHPALEPPKPMTHEKWPEVVVEPAPADDGIDMDVGDQQHNVIEHAFQKKRVTIEELSKHLLFKTLKTPLLEKIQKFSVIETFQENEMVHQPLDLIHSFSCLLEGHVAISHQNTVLLQLEGGTIIDEAELCMGTKYFFETRAKETTTILSVDKPALLALCKRQHEIAYHFLWHFYKSLSLKIISIIDMMTYEKPGEEMMWGLDILREVSQQRSMNQLEIHVLEKEFTRVFYSEGDFIYENQDNADAFYILLDGKVKLRHAFSGDQILIGPHEFFSEFSLISGSSKHVLSAKVESENASLIKVNRDDLKKFSTSKSSENFRLVETFWKIFSWKYFETLNFYFHFLKTDAQFLNKKKADETSAF